MDSSSIKALQSPLGRIRIAINSQNEKMKRYCSKVMNKMQAQKQKKEMNQIREDLAARLADFEARQGQDLSEEKLKEYMKWDSVEIEVNLKLGNDAFKCFTCDFTHDYIDINADYRN